jgi:natural product biosynthesis luciferase-like monooxygenase protein
MSQAFRCVLIGGESLLIQCEQALSQRGHQVVAVVSQRAPVRGHAVKQGIRVFKSARDLLAATDLQPIDYVFSVTNLSVLPPEVLALGRLGAINFHDGPLPQYAGLNTPVWALLHGATQYGITWHRMTADVDRGDILVQRRFDIDGFDTALTLNTKNYGAAVDGFEALLDGLAAGTLQGVPQTAPLEHYYGRKDRPRAAALIDWREDAQATLRLVRALDFGAYANPVASAKASVGGKTLRVTRAQLGVGAASQGVAPGTVTALDAASIAVSARDAVVQLVGFETLDGRPLTPQAAAAYWGLSTPGPCFDGVDDALADRLTDINQRVAPHEGFWLQRLTSRGDYELPTLDRKATPSGRLESLDAPVALLAGAGEDGALNLVATLLLLWARLADKDSFDVGLRTPALDALHDGDAGLFATHVPLRAALDFSQSAAAWREVLVAEWALVHQKGTYALDVLGRTPELRATASAAPALPTPLALSISVVDTLGQAQAVVGGELTVAVEVSTGQTRWFFDPSLLSSARVRQMQQQLQALFAGVQANPSATVGTLPLMDAATRDAVLLGWNQTAAPVRADVCAHQLFEAQAARTPDAIAVTALGESIAYRELDRRANQLARRLQSLGVKPDVLVGLMCERSVSLMVGLLAIHKAGGAYVPLDPTYPRDRIAYMVDDAKAPVILTLEHLRDDMPHTPATVIALDADWPSIATESDAAFDGGAQPEHLAYVIYTSGSTGKPKGVMVEHRNVVNFFAGMDAHLGASAQGTWLAVTSLSFDISVLELCWTLTHGFHVIVSSDEDRAAATGPARGPAADRALEFSLFYFSSDESEGVSDKYKLLMDGARFADQHGFSAVWTPERHFNAFGGLYPNPAVTGAAVAAVTQRVQIRAGSVVLPLHHPLRVAEEWSVVDNLSKGRVGLSFASGWHPNDFVLKPENFADNKNVMLRNIEVVRSLWRGNAHSFDGPLGKPVEVKVLPRPVQKELPYWVTSAGNPETFAAAGRIGANVLTHLLGQTVEELADKLAAYRQAWADAGHAGQGIVSLMLHTFVGPDEAAVRETVRRPLIEYLRSSANLVKQYAWAFPAFKRREGMSTGTDSFDLSTVSQDDMDALLEYSFERYYETSGLFGTPESCLKMIDAIKGIGVDDVACLIDFGVGSAAVLAHLPYLNDLRKRAKPRRALAADLSLPALLHKHPVTHLQCTPSMARMLLLDDVARPALAKLERMMVGGEALQPALAHELMGVLQGPSARGGRLMNMYGPTETTIWSAIHTLEPQHEGPVPLGRPMANQQIYVLDRRQQPLPVGVPGELVIGGLGVVRGYLHRPELTAERFLPHPVPSQPGRVYRTGDLARLREDGLVEFLGRLDHQVKVRGYRIELGEIEALIARQPGVSETVVIAREDTPGDVRLVAYVVSKPGVTLEPAALRETLRADLPVFMVPAHVVLLAGLPQTPNGKIDRKQLPAPEAESAVVVDAAAFVAPSGELEPLIAEVWRDVLKLPKVGVRDNFFDLGGHSLLAIQVLRALKDKLQRDLVITDIFRFPTVQSLAAHLSDAGAQGAAAREGQDRAQGRRAALARRAGARESAPT